MGTTVGKDREQPGKFAFELWDGFETIKQGGGFETMADATAAAQLAQREHLFGVTPGTIDDISDDELAELLTDAGFGE